MTHLFDSARFSANHAKSHINEFNLLARSFFQSKPHTVVSKPDPLYPTTHELYYLKLVKRLPARLNGLAGDAVINLRSALDNLGYSVAVASGKSGKHAHFPFGETLADAQSRFKNRSKDIPKEIFEFMIALKPYKGGNDTLWRLNKLANARKHQHFLRSTVFTSQITYEWGGGNALTKGIDGDGAADKIPIAWVRRGEPDLEYQLKLNTSIRFDDVDGIEFKQPAIALLNEFSRIVERIILGVEAESKRIGIIR